MGMNFSKIIVVNPQTSKSNLEILKSIIPEKLQKTDKYIDCRTRGNISISKTKNGIIEIYNSDIVESVFQNNKSKIINNLYNCLNNPELILFLQHYDSSNTFGYIIIKHGQVIRQRRSSAGNLLETFGNLLNFEEVLQDTVLIKAKYNYETEKFDEVFDFSNHDEKIESIYKIISSNELVSESTLSRQLFNSVMIEFLKTDLWDSMPLIDVREYFTFEDDLTIEVNRITKIIRDKIKKIEYESALFFCVDEIIKLPTNSFQEILECNMDEVTDSLIQFFDDLYLNNNDSKGFRMSLNTSKYEVTIAFYYYYSDIVSPNDLTDSNNSWLYENSEDTEIEVEITGFEKIMDAFHNLQNDLNTRGINGHFINPSSNEKTNYIAWHLSNFIIALKFTNLAKNIYEKSIKQNKKWSKYPLIAVSYVADNIYDENGYIIYDSRDF